MRYKDNDTCTNCCLKNEEKGDFIYDCRQRFYNIPYQYAIQQTHTTSNSLLVYFKHTYYVLVSDQQNKVPILVLVLLSYTDMFG